jgi:hypothetical protein
MVVRLISPGGLQGDSRPCFLLGQDVSHPTAGNMLAINPTIIGD